MRNLIGVSLSLMLMMMLMQGCAHSQSAKPVDSNVDGYVDAGGVRLHYVSRGTGPLILFVHGFPEFWYAWRNQLAEFGRDHRAVALDMRGFNLSSRPANPDAYQVPKLVEDLGAVADHFGARKFVLVGHDWGGVIAWSFAMAHRERLDKLVIINSPHPAVFMRELAQNPAQQRASQYMLMFRRPDAEQILSADNYAALRNVFEDLIKSGHMTSADLDRYVTAWSQPGALTGGLNYYRASRVGPPAPGESPGALPPVPAAAMMVRVPTLVIWGERDPYLLTGNLTGLDAYVPALTVKRFPDATHWVVHERPAEVNALIRDFIQ